MSSLPHSDMQLDCRHLGLVGSGETIKNAQEIYGWKRGGAESYVCATKLSVSTPEGRNDSRKYVCKAVFTFGPSSERLAALVARYDILARNGVNVPHTYYAGDGVLLQEFIDYSFFEYVTSQSQNPPKLACLGRQVLDIAKRLDYLRFSPVSFVPDLRVSANGRCFIVDTGEDIGAPGQAPLGSRKALDQATNFLRNQFPNIEMEVIANE